MDTTQIRLVRELDGPCFVAGSGWEHHVPESLLDAVLENARRFVDVEEDHRYAPLRDPMEARALGQQLADTFLPPLYTGSMSPTLHIEGTLLISSAEADLLNLPWELLPGRNDTFLTADPRWSILRTTRQAILQSVLPRVARPLRILFAACAPTDLSDIDFESEEEAILRIVEDLGDEVHLDFAEAGTFDELQNLIVEYNPHIVHISGHGYLQHGVGHLCFENERGLNDPKDSRAMAEGLFEGRSVYLAFISGCNTAQAGVAGICQSLTTTGVVPIAIGWGAKIGDNHAMQFAVDFYLRIAMGKSIGAAMGEAQACLFRICQIQQGGVDLLDVSFALPQLYASESLDKLIDESLARVPVNRPGIRHTLLGDAVQGLSEGFVGRRRILQRSRSILRAGDHRVLFLTGMGGTGKSTLATRLANRFQADGYEIAAARATDDRFEDFPSRILMALSVACEILSHSRDASILNNGRISVVARLQYAVEVLNKHQILLILDNLESVMTKPPERPKLLEPLLEEFLGELCGNLTGSGRAIITCRYLPDGFHIAMKGVLHEPMPDFSEGDFIKYLYRHEATADRIRQGMLRRDVLSLFYNKFGATPRFLEQARSLLAVIDSEDLFEQLESLDGTEAGFENQELLELRKRYFQDHLLIHLYQGLAPKLQRSLSCLAVAKFPLPIAGVMAITELDETSAQGAMTQCLSRALIQRFGDHDAEPHYLVYSLQRDFLLGNNRIDSDSLIAAHGRASAYLRNALENVGAGVAESAIWNALYACYHHADISDGVLCRRWAALKIAGRYSRLAQHAQASEVLRNLLERDRHPSVLHATGAEFENIAEWKVAEKFYKDALAGYRANSDRAGEGASLHQLGSLCLKRGDYKSARKLLSTSLQIRQASGDRSLEASTLHNLAAIDMHEGLHAQAREKYLKALGIKQAAGDRPGEASTLLNLADIYLTEGDTTKARESIEKCAKAFEDAHDRHGVASAALRTAQIDLHEGKFDSAENRCEEAFRIFHSAGRRDGEAAALNQIAILRLTAGNYPAARVACEKALRIREEIGDQAGTAMAFLYIGSISLKEGRLDEALSRFKESICIAKTIGDLNLEANAWHESGLVKIQQKKVANAKSDLKKALSIRRRTGNIVGEVATTFAIVHIDLNEGKLSAARKGLLQLRVRVRRMCYRAGEAAIIHEIASIDLKEGQYSASEAGLLECMELRREVKDKFGEAVALAQMAALAWKKFHDGRAVYLACSAYAILSSIGAAEQRVVMSNVQAMANELGISHAELNRILETAVEGIRWKKCANLAREAMGKV